MIDLNKDVDGVLTLRSTSNYTLTVVQLPDKPIQAECEMCGRLATDHRPGYEELQPILGEGYDGWFIVSIDDGWLDSAHGTDPDVYVYCVDCTGKSIGLFMLTHAVLS